MRLMLIGAGGRLAAQLARSAGGAGGAARRVEVIGIDHARLELTDHAAIERLVGEHEFDVLVNCAGYCPPPGQPVDAARAFEVNALPAGVLASCCRRKRAVMVQLSGCEVFDGVAGRAYTEQDAPGPITVAGAARAMAERLTLNANPQALVLRLGRLFGQVRPPVVPANGAAGATTAADHCTSPTREDAAAPLSPPTLPADDVDSLIRHCLDEARLRGRRELHIGDDQRFSLLYLSDAAALILSLLVAKAPPGVYHLANAGAVTGVDLARRVIAAARLQARVISLNSRSASAHPLRDHSLDIRRLASVLGRIPHWSDALDRHLRHDRLL